MNNSLAAVSDKSNNEIDPRESVKVCDPIDGVTIDGGVESTGMTSFVQEACESIDVLGSHYVPSSLVTKQPDIQNLTEYFSRPRVIQTGTIATGTSNRIFAINMTNTQLFNTTFVNGYDRLRGVYGVRFKMVFTLQVAATPFHQGLLALNWQYETTSADTNQYVRSSNSGSCTNIPHVRLDLAETTMVQLAVPFLNIREFVPVGDSSSPTLLTWNLGLISLNSILPVRYGAGATDPGYRLTVHLEDMHLIGAAPISLGTVVLQGGKKLSPVEEEFENDAYPYSSSLHAASRTVKWIGRGIPSLSSIAGPTSWFLGKAAGIVRYLGFSKPQIQEPIMRMQPNDTVAEFNVDVPSSTMTIGPFASNTLSINPQFAGTDVDEMSLSYVLSQWTQLRIGQFLTTHTIGTRLYVCPISPNCFWYRSTLTGGAPFCNIPRPSFCPAGAAYNSILPTGVGFWASLFKQWRGDLEFRITFAKTKIHGGRVLLTYCPDANADRLTTPLPTVTVPTTATTGPQPFGYSAIFDLRDGNVITFDVPFVNDVPYCSYFGSTGTFTMEVYDPLQASSTVATTVEFMVEIRAKPNFELAFPVAPLMPAHTRGTILQAGKMLSSIDSSASEACVGEHVVSAKQLIMIPKASTFAIPGGDFVANLPFWYYQPQMTVLTPGPVVYPKEAFSFGGNISTCYLYARGGMDAHAYNLTSGGISHKAFSYSAFEGNTQVSATSSYYNASGANMSRAITTGPVLHARFPAYQRTARINTQCHGSIVWNSTNPTFTATPTQYTPHYWPRLTITTTFVGDVAVVTRCAADDAMLGHYMGPTPAGLILNQASAVWDPDASSVILQSGRMLDDMGIHLKVEETETPVVPIPTPSPFAPLRRVASLSRVSRPQPTRYSGDAGITPSSLTGKLTSIVHTLPPAVTATVEAATAIATVVDVIEDVVHQT